MDFSIFKRHTDYCEMYSRKEADQLVYDYIVEIMPMEDLEYLLNNMCSFPYNSENVIKFMQILDFLNYIDIDLFINNLYHKYYKKNELLDVMCKYPIVTKCINDIMLDHMEILTFEELKYITTYIELEHVVLSTSITAEQFDLCNVKNIVYFSVNDYITDEIISRYNIKTLYLRTNKIITDAGLSHCSDMEYIDLGENTNISDLSIKNMKKLEVIFMERNTNITDDAIHDKIFLEELYLGANNIITDDGIKNLINLEYLFTDCNINITDEGIFNLLKLKHFVIGDSANFTDASVSRLVNLEKLTIGNSIYITDESVCKLKNLKDINIMSGINVGKSLQYLPNLKNINIGDSVLVSDDVLLKIKDNIEQLFAGDIVNVPVSDKSVKRMKNLKRLHLRANKNINNKSLRKLTELKYLSLGWNDNISNKGLKFLKKLEHLSLDRNRKITNSGIAHLTNLGILILGDNTKITNTSNLKVIESELYVIAPTDNMIDMLI